MKKSYIKILFIAEIIILILFSAKELNNKAKFVDDNFKANVLAQTMKESLEEEDLININFLTFIRDEGIDNFEDLKKFTALDYLELRGFSQNEVNTILENCPTTLSHMNITGDSKYSLGSIVLSASENIYISTSEEISVYHVKDTNTICKSIRLNAKEIDGVNNLGILTNIEVLNLKAEEGFDDKFNLKAVAENSKTISELVVVGGRLSNYESILLMSNLETLVFQDTGITDVAWADGLIDKIDYMAIGEGFEYPIENIFDKR